MSGLGTQPGMLGNPPVVSDPLVTPSGRAGRYFDGANRLEGPIFVPRAEITVGGWVYPVEFDNFGQVIGVGSYYNSASSFALLLSSHSSGLRINVSIANTSYSIATIGGGYDFKWTHIAFSWKESQNNSRPLIYVNGKVYGSGNVGNHTGLIPDSGLPYVFGENYSGGHDTTGGLAHVQEFDRCLDADEILQWATTGETPDGLLHHWFGDEDSLADLAGSADLTETSGTTYFLPGGPYGTTPQGPRFGRGSRDFAGLARDLSFTNPHLGDSELTWATWLNFDTAVRQGIIGMASWSGGTPFGLFRLEASRQVRFSLYDEVLDDFRDVYSTSHPTLGEWHHVAGVYDGTDLRVYVDGILVCTPTAMSEPLTSTPSTTTLLYVGNSQADSSLNNFYGMMSDTRGYRVALTADEIAELADRRSTTNPTRGLAWHINGDADDTTDLSGNVSVTNNGTTYVPSGPFGDAPAEMVEQSFGSASRSLTQTGDERILLPADLIGGQDEFTFCTWFKPRSYCISGNIIGFYSTDFHLLVRMDNGAGYKQLEAYSNIGGSRRALPNNLTFALDEWQWLVVRYDGSTFTMRLDGVEVSPPVSCSGNVLEGTPATNYHCIGDSDNSSARQIDAEFSDYRFYNRALSDAELLQAKAFQPVPEGLILRLFSDKEETAPLLVDWSGNGHWAENNGSVWSSEGPGLLLDVHSDALAGYSTRLIRRGYSGALFGVRRISDDVRADLYPNGDGEITLDSPVTITSGSSSATTLGELSAAPGHTDVDGLGAADDIEALTWYDQSGNGNDASHTTINWFIYVVQAGVLSTEGGKFALDFDSRAVHSYTFSTPDFNVSDFTLVDVSKSATYNGVFANKTATEFGRLQNWNGKALLTGTAGFDADGTLQPGHLARRLRSYVHKSTPTARLNGAADTIVPRAGWTQAPLRSVYIGGRAYQHPAYQTETNLQEALIFAGDKSDDLDAMEADINSFYSIY